VVTFAFKIPLQATAAADPFTVTVMVLAMEDEDTRVTQSIEEQGVGQAAFQQRAAELGATAVTLLAGGRYNGALPARTLCSVRTAGPMGAPTATLESGAPCVSIGMMVAWTGAVSSDWSDGGNWNLLRVPTANDTVVIAPAEHQPVISDGDKTIHTLMTTDTLATSLDLGGHTLTITGDVSAPGSTVSNGTVRMDGTDVSLVGTLSTLKVEGGIRLKGSTTATGPVTVGGTLSTNGQPLTISLP
jgi:hypothetical protein